MKDRGRISIGCLLMAVVLAAAVYHGYLFGMPFLYQYAFEEKLFKIAEHTFHQDEESVYKIIRETAAEYHIELDPKNIIYEETRSSVHIEVYYEVPVETPLIKRTLKMKVDTNRKFTS